MKPETSYQIVVEWFKRAADGAKAQGRPQSAQLWIDGLEHLETMKAQRNELLAALKKMLDAFYEDPMGADTDGAVEQAREAIAKATGGAR